MWAKSKGNCSSSSSSNLIAGLFVVDNGIGVIQVVQDAAALLVRGLGLSSLPGTVKHSMMLMIRSARSKAGTLTTFINSLSTPTHRPCA
uniref:WS_DGAT_C domain-containing protein n=1 Tax=Panagrellus redivivus TaxID=6233 RepID=A0A7E4VNZ9_PANRE